jgi:mRNA interferase MazF
MHQGRPARLAVSARRPGAARNPAVWTVVKAPLPSTDRPVRQRRRARVVARAGEATGTALLWGLMVTSAHNRGRPGEVLISDPVEVGVPAPSLVRCEKVATIDARQAIPLGSLPQADRARVAAWLRRCLADAIRPTCLPERDGSAS